MNVHFLCTLLILVKVFSAAYSRDFSYAGPMGPEHWAEEYSSCNGKLQSPINIVSRRVTKKIFKELEITSFEDEPLEGTLINNGHTIVARFRYAKTPTVTSGPLGSEVYTFVQLHFHWGQNNLEGSEDRINNQTFPAELHMVFRNSRYESFAEAVNKKRGIAVLAFFFEIPAEGMFVEKPTYEVLTSQLANIPTANSTTAYKDPPSLFALSNAGEIHNYYTYIGSLTTPPCSEDVVWIDFDRPIWINESQIERFRHVNDFNGSPLSHNYRPLQALNDRKIYAAVGKDENSAIPFIKDAAAHLTRAHKFEIFLSSIIIIILANAFAF